jgi:uncharacterized protein YycO
MKTFPRSPAAYVRLALLCSILVWCAYRYRPDRFFAYNATAKRDGDILFQSLPHNGLVDAIEGVTRSPWSHCGILVWRQGRWEVAESIGDVHYTPLSTWIRRGRGCEVAAYRLQNPPAIDGAKLIAGVDKLLGRPYDYRYAPDDAAIYCSELVYRVYEREFGIEIGTWEPLGALNWKGSESFIKGMEGNVPMDRPMITPVGITRSPKVRRVFPRYPRE